MSVKCQKQTPPTTRSPGLHARATRPAPWQSVDPKKVPNLVSRHPYRPSHTRQANSSSSGRSRLQKLEPPVHARQNHICVGFDVTRKSSACYSRDRDGDAVGAEIRIVVFKEYGPIRGELVFRTGADRPAGTGLAGFTDLNAERIKELHICIACGAATL